MSDDVKDAGATAGDAGEASNKAGTGQAVTAAEGGDLRGAERKAAGVITIGNALGPVALFTLLLAATYFLPHSGSVRGFDVLFNTETAQTAATALPERIHAVLKLLTILMVVATLISRQVIVGISMWYAFAAGWMRQSRPPEGPGAGIAFGLWLAIICSVGLFIAVSWLVFRKSALQSALALARRDQADSDPVLRAQQVYLRSGLAPYTQTDVEMVDDRREASRRRRAARRAREAESSGASRDDAAGAAPGAGA